MNRFKVCIGCTILSICLSFCSSSKKVSYTGSETIIPPITNEPVPDKNVELPKDVSLSNPIDNAKKIQLQKKYSAILGTSPESITNIKLYLFIDKWLNTPYKWGGTDKNGIDCSALIQRLLNDVYDINIPRTSVDQFLANWVERFASHSALSEGDLVFFSTMKGKTISHVGLYVGHRMFINSSSKGVSFGNLDDPYWKSKYVAAGRIKQSMISSIQK